MTSGKCPDPLGGKTHRTSFSGAFPRASGCATLVCASNSTQGPGSTDPNPQGHGFVTSCATVQNATCKNEPRSQHVGAWGRAAKKGRLKPGSCVAQWRSHLTQNRGVRSSNPFGGENSSVADSSFLRGTRQRRSTAVPLVWKFPSATAINRDWPFGDCTVAKGDEKITLPAAGPVNVTNPAKKTRRHRLRCGPYTA